MKQTLSCLLLLLFSTVFPQLRGKVQLSPDLIEVLQRKSNINDPDNRVIVAFKTQSDPSESLQKIPLQLLKAEEYRVAVGNFVVAEMNAENWELEQRLLEIVEETQIVRRLPIGNTFILEGLNLQQADKISQMDRTVMLALSRFTRNAEIIHRNQPPKTGDTLNKCAMSESRSKFPFNEPVEDIREWKYPTCDSLHKSTCQINIPWNIQRIKTPQAWARGYRGKGIIYGVIDTGVSYKHPALVGNYLGRRENGTFDHNYAWYDAVRTAPKLFGRDRKKDRKLEKLEQSINEEWNYAHLYKSTSEKNHDDYDEGYDGDEETDDTYDNFSGFDSFSGFGGFYDNYDNTHYEDAHDSYENTSDDDSFDPSYNVMEKIGKVVDKCEYGMKEPCDAGGHGTHVASTAVGGYGLGAAPEAQWMACRSIASDLGREEDSLACLNFFLAPADLNGKNPRPELRPHVIGNSYGWESWAEVTGAGIDLAVKRLESAGTVMVFAAGNSGPDCGSVHSAFSFTVGATTEQGTLASFSSRGPWTISPAWAKRPFGPRQPLLIKPDISAPGHSIIGALGSQHVSKMSGTSMAAPHVAGSVSLLRKHTSFQGISLIHLFSSPGMSSLDR